MTILCHTSFLTFTEAGVGVQHIGILKSDQNLHERYFDDPYKKMFTFDTLKAFMRNFTSITFTKDNVR